MADPRLNAAELDEATIAAMRAELVETDGEPMDSSWHRDQMMLLIDSIKCHWRDRTDFYAGGNMFIYYSLRQARTHEYKGPDFFVVKNVDGTIRRKYWWVFEEDNRFPDFIVELLSPSTAREDRTRKKQISQDIFATPEYFLYDPDKERLEGFRLEKHKYAPLKANASGWMWSEELQLWLGTWQGSYLEMPDTYLRFFDAKGRLVPTFTELGRQKLKKATARVQAEKKRPDALAAEVARLRAQLGPKNGHGKKSNG